MSGTSLDGVDVVRVAFKHTDKWVYRILEAHTHPYSSRWKNKLTNAMDFSLDAVELLNKEYTNYLGKLLRPYIESSKYSKVNFISSHGHTLFHEPEKGMTLQLGNLPSLSKDLRTKVICDFRSADVALGGQGAPLVPGGEVYLFPDYAACLNLGGFANISRLDKDPIQAYDICGVNIVLNFWANKIGLLYDDGGRIARKGSLIPELKMKLDRLSFYAQKPPKSLGKEWVLLEVLPLMESYASGGIENILYTYVMHISEIIQKHLPKNGKTLATGGGAYHHFLVETINQNTANQLIIPSKTIVEFKEALIFAFLGLLRAKGENNCLSSVTGAPYDHSSGKIFTF